MSKYEERKNLDILSTNILMKEALDKILIAIEGIAREIEIYISHQTWDI